MNPLRNKLQKVGYSFVGTWPNISVNELKSAGIAFEEVNKQTIPIHYRPSKPLYFGFTLTNWHPTEGQSRLNVRFR